MELIGLRAPVVALATAVIAASSSILGGGITRAGASATTEVTPADGVPSTGGLFRAPVDFADFGYQAAEFYVAGTARSYHDVAGEPFTSDGLWTVAPDAAPTPAFKTRIHVAMPQDPGRFNGTLYVEWFNVTSLMDGAVDWGGPHVEITRQGAGYVGVSAQQVGVDTAIDQLPDRYGPAGANLVHPGDAYSYDIFSQIGRVVRADAAQIFGPEYAVQRLIATGESQSAGRLVTYVNAFGKDEIYDGYLVHSRGSNAAPLRNAIAGPPSLPEIVTPANTLIRTGLDVLVFVFQTETDSRAVRQDDSPSFRWWETPGTAHADISMLNQKIIASNDGMSSETAELLFDAMLHPIFQAEVPGFPLPPCDLAINAGGAMWVLRAAFEHLNAWVTDGTSPPVSDRIATVGGSPTGELILDEYGNPIGGIRTPHVDVPVATLRGSGNSPGFCSLFGTTVPFSAETLAQLYRTRGEFVSKWSRSVDSAVRAGFIRRGDARHLKISAARSTVGQSSVACTILRSRNPERGAINHGNTAIHSCIRRSLPRAIR